jgi:UDP-N-acetylmuramate--alanine ligase
MKLMGRDIMDALSEVLDAGDRVYLPEIYYAGGSADQTLSSRDLVAYLNARKPIGTFISTKQELIRAVAAEAESGDVVISMGARDPALGDFARQLFDRLAS